MNYNEIMVAQAKSRVLRELGIDKETKKTTYSGELTTQGERSMYIAEGRLFNLAVGATCTVVLDSGTYTEVVKADESGVLYIGDPGVGNGKSYTVGEYMIDDENWQSMVADHNKGAKFTVTTENTTTTPIKLEYLPGVCLPVVELSQETMAALFTTGEATCTKEETAVFLSAWDASIPVVLRADFEVSEKTIKLVQVGYIWGDQDFDGYRFTNHSQNMRARVYPDGTVEFTLEYS